MRIESPAFVDGEQIPKKYTEDGENVSPPLEWKDPPAETREYALIVEDPDAPRADPWVHWMIYRIPGEVKTLPEGVPQAEEVNTIGGAQQGQNSWQQRNLGYRGPAPPKGHGTHHYHFKLFALREPLQVVSGVAKGALLKAMENRILAEADLVGTYERT